MGVGAYQLAISVGVFVLIVSWVVSKRGTSLHFWLGILLLIMAFQLYATGDSILGDVWQALLSLPQVALDLFRSATT